MRQLKTAEHGLDTIRDQAAVETIFFLGMHTTYNLLQRLPSKGIQEDRKSVV